MASETDVLNDALGQSGLPAITSLSANEPNAAWCRTFYPELRRSFFRAYRPNCSRKRATLQQNATPPEFGYAFAYDLPNNYLMLLEYNGDAPDLSSIDPLWQGIPPSWKVEGNQILTNDSVVVIRYIADIDNPALWDPLFSQVISALLSSKLIAAVWKDLAKSQAKLKEALEVWLPPAMAADGQSDSAAPFIVDDLTHGR